MEGTITLIYIFSLTYLITESAINEIYFDYVRQFLSLTSLQAGHTVHCIFAVK